MEINNEQLSAIIDNEVVDKQLLDQLLIDEPKQMHFSRYQLIGDVMRGQASAQSINIDISQNVMAEIKRQAPLAPVTILNTSLNKTRSQGNNNVVSLFKRFGQYAVAASVAAVVVMASLVSSPSSIEKNKSGLEVLNTVPFGGGVAPVSLEATPTQSKQAIKEHNQRLEALLNDHQLQLQIQP